MAEEFLAHSRQWDIEPDLVTAIMGEELDIENLIEGLDQIAVARTPLEAIGQDPIPFERVDKLRAEVEWFVQHVAERVVPRDAQLMWGPTLRSIGTMHLTLATTNYDRAIELAANAEAVTLGDGFASFEQGETAPWVGFDENPDRPPIIKLHGSTDWYSNDAGEPRKLRHPMPLFGRSVLRLADGQKLGSALVLPSREKLLTRAPYPRLSQSFLNATDGCDLAVFVGSSMRDPHILGAAESIAPRAPLFVVNPEGNSYGIEGATGIAQPASTFLISTLPNALLTKDPAAALTDAEPETSGGATLTAVRQALDAEAPTDVRCQALNELDDKNATLDSFLIGELLSTEDPTVARYALGLIPHSTNRTTLIETAAGCPHADDLAFCEDLDLLRRLSMNAPAG